MWVDELVCYFVLLLLAAVAAFFFRGARGLPLLPATFFATAPVGLSAAMAFLSAACAVAVCGSPHLISDLPRLANSALALEKTLPQQTIVGRSQIQSHTCVGASQPAHLQPRHLVTESGEG